MNCPYKVSDITDIEEGVFIRGEGYLIRGSIYSRKYRYTFIDKEVCLADNPEEAIRWMNRIHGWETELVLA